MIVSQNRANMLAALDAVIPQLMRELSDEACDRGDVVEQCGWLWLIENDRTPYRGPKGYLWSLAADWKADNLRLPSGCLKWIEQRNWGDQSYPTLSAALYAAAHAVGAMLAEEAEKQARERERASCALCHGGGTITLGTPPNVWREPCPRHKEEGR